MPRFTDLPKWRSLSKDEREMVKSVVHIKSYKNYDGKGSVSPRELEKGHAYQESARAAMAEELEENDG